MKRIFLVIMLATIFGLTVTTYAGTFFDDFNDGNANGWVFHSYGFATQIGRIFC